MIYPSISVMLYMFDQLSKHGSSHVLNEENGVSFFAKTLVLNYSTRVRVSFSLLLRILPKSKKVQVSKGELQGKLTGCVPLPTSPESGSSESFEEIYKILHELTKIKVPCKKAVMIVAPPITNLIDRPSRTSKSFHGEPN